METTPMQDLIALITPVVTYIFTVVGDALDTITESPLLVFTMGFLVVGGAIGLISRMIRK